MAKLEDRLKKKNKFLSALIPKPIVKYMDQVTQDLLNKGYNARALKVGDRLPEGFLMNSLEEKVDVHTYTDQELVIISFYRGAWCPYCNLELSFYDDLLKKHEGVKMLAISPERPDVSLKKLDLAALSFTVLSDVNNVYARRMNLVFDLPKKLKFYYRLMGVNLKKSQGSGLKALPIPATYIVKDHIIRHAWLDVDYTKRPEPEEVIGVYEALLNI